MLLQKTWSHSTQYLHLSNKLSILVLELKKKVTLPTLSPLSLLSLSDKSFIQYTTVCFLWLNHFLYLFLWRVIWKYQDFPIILFIICCITPRLKHKSDFFTQLLFWFFALVTWAIIWVTTFTTNIMMMGSLQQLPGPILPQNRSRLVLCHVASSHFWFKARVCQIFFCQYFINMSWSEVNSFRSNVKYNCHVGLFTIRCMHKRNVWLPTRNCDGSSLPLPLLFSDGLEVSHK